MKKIICLFIVVLLFSTVLIYAGDQEKKAEKRMKPVLVIMDIQNQYLPYMSDGDKKFGLEVINYAIAMFREHGFPIIRVYHSDPKHGPAPDSEAFQFPASVKIEETDAKIIKNYPSAFTKTDLETILREKDRNTVFLCGLSAVGCVLATYYGAMEREFDAFMIKDALLSHDAELTDFAEEITDAVGYSVMKAMLNNAEK